MREEFIELLTRLVMDGFITLQEAESLIDEFDRGGTLPEGWALPLPLDEAVPDEEGLREAMNEALLFFADVLSDAVDEIQDEFMRDVERLADDLRRGAITLKTWHEQMRDLIVDYLARAAQVGAQRAIVGDDEDELLEIFALQLAFLSRFADQAASGRLSDAQIRERAKLYAGEGRALFYEQAGRTAALYGWVEDYIAVDDRNTCGPCARAEAQGPYLPGQGPMPGRVCLGRGYCRCRRALRYDVQAYLRLV
jgi:hypothetical protein